jgi:DNA mismatch repair protein PMS2
MSLNSSTQTPGPALDDDFFVSMRAPSTASATPRPSTSRTLSTASGDAPACVPLGSRSRHPSSSPASSGKGFGIRRLSTECAQAVRTGQAVLDAAAVVKELVENSLDAGASRVDIRLFGKAAADRIVVSDNGSGVHPNNHSSLCLPHATSKISEFADLDAVMTYGFRGEAMAAIAALAETVTVVTRTAAEHVALSLSYGHDGSLVSQVPTARAVGTTTQVDCLFSRLPVRRQEALKHSARDVARCLSVVQSYALVATKVRFELRVGSETRLLTQPPSKTASSGEDDLMRASIASVLGRTQASAMERCTTDVLLSIPRNAAGSTGAGSSGECNDIYGLRGFVSKTSHGGSGGGGKLSGAWQFFFINRRPVDMPRVARAINESFRRFALTSNASPAFVLSLSVPPGTFDVNLSPDKRVVMLHREQQLVIALQQHLESIWSPCGARAIPVQGVSHVAGILVKQRRNELVSAALQSDGSCGDDGSFKPCAVEEQRDGEEARLRLLRSRQGANPEDSANVLVDNECSATSPDPTFRASKPIPDVKRLRDSIALSSFSAANTCPKSSNLMAFVSRRGRERHTNASVFDAAAELLLTAPVSGDNHQSKTVRKRTIASFVPSAVNVVDFDSGVSKYAAKTNPVVVLDEECIRAHKAMSTMSIDFNFESILKRREKRNLKKRARPWQSDVACDDEHETQSPLAQRLRMGKADEAFACSLGVEAAVAAVSVETDAEQSHAEREMFRVFKQAWFADLVILGQFNLGFIICLLHDKDLFIVDQHASDEKFNFEDLQASTIIQTQRLLRPLALDLAVEDELLVVENLERFRAGGFEIEYRPSNSPTRRLFLRSQPSSKHTMFVIDDLREMISTLKLLGSIDQRRNEPVLRPSRVRAMFASRACRKSVMIGTPLTKGQMVRVVRNLERLASPWFCPHGRYVVNSETQRCSRCW